MKIQKILLLALMAQPMGAWAQTMSLRQCLDMARKQNLSLMVARKSTERARAMQGTAWDIDKTELSLSQDPTSGGSPDNALQLSQTIEFPTVYAARRRQLKAQTRAEESRERVEERQLLADVESSYWQMVYLAERMRIIGRLDSILERNLQITAARCKAGESRQMETLSAEHLLQENRLLMASAKSDLDAERMKLMELLSATEPVAPADTVLAPIPYRPQGYRYSATAEGEYAQARLAVSDKALRAAKSEYAPSISLALKNQLVITSWNPYHQDRSRFDGGNFMGFEVGVGIPLFYGATKARVKAARKEKEMVELEMRREESKRQKEYASLLNRFNLASRQLAYYERDGAKSVSEMERLGSLEFENGEISYTEYIRALEEANYTRMNKAQAVNEYNQAVVELKRLEAQ